MPQTLLAILAMVVTSLFAFGQHRSILESRLKMIHQEVALRSTSVAVNVIEEIGSLAFDEATKDEAIMSSNDLTILTDGPAELETAQADDIDDFNNRERTVTLVRKIGSLNFVARSTVQYVNSDGTASPTVATKYKELTVSVKSADLASSDSVYISKIISCGSRCNW